jgi:hypothetical protein
MFSEPLIHIETEILFRPEHPGQSLTHHARGVFSDAGSDGSVKLVRLISASLYYIRKLAPKRVPHVGWSQITHAQPDRLGFSGLDIDFVMRGHLGALLLRVDGVLLSVHDAVVDPILDVTARVRRPKIRSLFVSFSVNSSGVLSLAVQKDFA